MKRMETEYDQCTPAFTMFEASKSAILLIDHQVGTMQLVKNLPIDRVKRFSLALAKTAVALDMPLVLTSSQEDRIQGPLLPELQEIAPEAYAKRIQRAGVADAWSDLNFKRAVEATGRKQLVMAGITTDVCLVFPAINAVRDGYAVQCVMDASGSPYELSEETSRQRMQAAGVGTDGDAHGHRRTGARLEHVGSSQTFTGSVRRHSAARPALSVTGWLP